MLPIPTSHRMLLPPITVTPIMAPLIIMDSVKTLMAIGTVMHTRRTQAFGITPHPEPLHHLRLILCNRRRSRQARIVLLSDLRLQSVRIPARKHLLHNKSNMTQYFLINASKLDCIGAICAMSCVKLASSSVP